MALGEMKGYFNEKVTVTVTSEDNNELDKEINIILYVLFFLFNGRKPKKVNSVVSKPEQIKAFTKAQGPGIETTSISSIFLFAIEIVLNVFKS